MSDSQLPKLINAHHIGKILKISYVDACNILELGTLPVFVLGNTKRVLTKDFYMWLKSKVTFG